MDSSSAMGSCITTTTAKDDILNPFERMVKRHGAKACLQLVVMHLVRDGDTHPLPPDVVGLIVDQFLYQKRFESVHYKMKAPHPDRRDKTYDFLRKIVMIGSSRVGKSVLMLKFADASFTSSFISTIGVDFRFRNLEVDGYKMKLQIWDTSGQERFRTITSAYYRGADAIMMLYDITDRKSFECIEEWKKEVDRFASTKNVVMMLVGTKLDATVDAHNRVSADEAQVCCDALNIPHFIETSAKTGHNVHQAFETVAASMIGIDPEHPFAL